MKLTIKTGSVQLLDIEVNDRQASVEVRYRIPFWLRWLPMGGVDVKVSRNAQIATYSAIT